MILRNSFIQARVDLPTSPWVVDRHFQPFWEEESQDKWVVDLTEEEEEEEEAPSEFWLKMGWNGVNSSPKDSRVCFQVLSTGQVNIVYFKSVLKNSCSLWLFTC